MTAKGGHSDDNLLELIATKERELETQVAQAREEARRPVEGAPAKAAGPQGQARRGAGGGPGGAGGGPGPAGSRPGASGVRSPNACRPRLFERLERSPRSARRPHGRRPTGDAPEPPSAPR